jgi:hypothetical protein
MLLIDHSTHTGSGARAPICLTGSPMQSDCAEVSTEMEYGLMKRCHNLLS